MTRQRRKTTGDRKLNGPVIFGQTTLHRFRFVYFFGHGFFHNSLDKSSEVTVINNRRLDDSHRFRFCPKNNRSTPVRGRQKVTRLIITNPRGHSLITTRVHSKPTDVCSDFNYCLDTRVFTKSRLLGKKIN